jgi:hypothetical protein
MNNILINKVNMKVTRILFGVWAVVVMTACSGGGGSKNESVDVPPYALAEGSIFDSNVPKGCYAIADKIVDVNGYDYDSYGRLTTSSGMRDLSGKFLVLGEEEYVVVMLGTDGFTLNETDGYTLHALVHEANPENEFTKNLTGDYCDDYLFVKDEELADAIETFQATEKKENQASQFSVDTIQGGKTYKGVVLKVVKYFGKRYWQPNPELWAKSFRDKTYYSVYLDCGAVVLIDHDKARISFLYYKEKLEGKTIDCLVSADNRVIEYELTTNN